MRKFISEIIFKLQLSVCKISCTLIWLTYYSLISTRFAIILRVNSVFPLICMIKTLEYKNFCKEGLKEILILES